MQRFYRLVITSTINSYYWSLDYIYVTYTQLVGFILKYDATIYIDSSLKKSLPIILLPGVYEKWYIMKPIADLLHRQGYSVHVVEGLGYNTGTVEEMAEQVVNYTERMHITKYLIVAHSKGGLIAKYLLNEHNHNVVKVVTINTPFSGSKYARLLPYKTIRTFLPTSPIITTLSENIESNSKITSIYGVFDPHIPEGSYLPGATNVQLRTRGHFRIISDKSVLRAIISSLR
jgi:triacylglycerol lipase